VTEEQPVVDLPRIPIDERTRVLVLTGAGISAESGLATFRGADGLWEGHRVEDVASPEGFAANPELVWRFYSERRKAAAAAAPNAAHLALVALERRLGDRFLLATQNVDGLHGRAGSGNLAEMHGTLWRTKCSACLRPAVADASSAVEPPLPRCACGALLRPDIVWFGELLDPTVVGRIDTFVIRAAEADDPFVFLAVGTSGNVWPASGYVRVARRAGATTWLANLDPAANGGDFDHFVCGPAATTLPWLLGVDG
jgi:NAD-dependent deacetylase